MIVVFRPVLSLTVSDQFEKLLKFSELTEKNHSSIGFLEF